MSAATVNTQQTQKTLKQNDLRMVTSKQVIKIDFHAIWVIQTHTHTHIYHLNKKRINLGHQSLETDRKIQLLLVGG